MSTNGVIAKATQEGFTGVYHHWDSYPEGLGKTLHELYNGHFDQDLNQMLDYLLGHVWSTINESDFNLDPGFMNMGKTNFSTYKDNPHGPECYCHGDRDEKFQTLNQDQIEPWFFVYVFDEGRVINVIGTVPFFEGNHERIRYGNKDFYLLGSIKLDEDWKDIIYNYD